jgi:hypothetical protein
LNFRQTIWDKIGYKTEDDCPDQLLASLTCSQNLAIKLRMVAQTNYLPLWPVAKIWL